MNHTHTPASSPQSALPTDGCATPKVCHPSLRHLAVGIAITLGHLAFTNQAAMAANPADTLNVVAGVAVFDETGGLHLDLATTRVAIAPVWASNPIAKPDLPAGFGVGDLFIHTSAGLIKVSVTASMSAYDIAAAINARKGRARASVVNNGVHHQLMIAAESGNNPAAFEDTTTLHIPASIDAFEDTGTLHIPGNFVATSFGQTIASAPFKSSTKAGLIGAGTLWLTMGEDTLAVDVTPTMSLNNLRDAINAENEAFAARVVKTTAGHSLVIDAARADMTDLLIFEDTTTLHIPGGIFSFEDTGTLRADAGLFSFEDTTTLHTSGGGVAFEDTGTLHIPGGFFAFEDTTTLHIPRSVLTLDYNGALRVNLGVKINNM